MRGKWGEGESAREGGWYRQEGLGGKKRGLVGQFRRKGARIGREYREDWDGGLGGRIGGLDGWRVGWLEGWKVGKGVPSLYLSTLAPPPSQ